MKQMFFPSLTLSLTFHVTLLGTLLWLSSTGRLSKITPLQTVYTVSLVSSSTLPRGGVGGGAGGGVSPPGPQQSRVAQPVPLPVTQPTLSPSSREKLPPKGVGKVQEKSPPSKKTEPKPEKIQPKSEVPDDVRFQTTKRGKPKTAGPEGYKRKGGTGQTSPQTSKQVALKGGTRTTGSQSGAGQGGKGTGGQGSGGTGSGMVGVRGPGPGMGAPGMPLDSAFDFPDYLASIRNKIWENWTPPFEGREAKTRRATVYFKILRDGKIIDVRVESESGSFPFDRSTFEAVNDINKMSPLPPLPQSFAGEDLGVHFVF